MIRRLIASTALAAVAIGFVSTGRAEALTLPAGDGTVECSIAGKVTARAIASDPTKARVRITAAAAGCTYNGVEVPGLSARFTTTTVVDKAAACAALADGSVSATTVVRVKLGTTVLGSAKVGVTISGTPSASGTHAVVDGSSVVSGIAIDVHADVLTNRPAGDLCSGAPYLLFAGSGSLGWDRP